MNMKFGTNKTPVEVIKEGTFGDIREMLEIFILVLLVNGTENHGKNLMS